MTSTRPTIQTNLGLFETLPLEVFSEIQTYLSETDRVQLKRTSRGLEDLVNAYWLHPYTTLLRRLANRPETALRDPEYAKLIPELASEIFAAKALKITRTQDALTISSNAFIQEEIFSFCASLIFNSGFFLELTKSAPQFFKSMMNANQLKIDIYRNPASLDSGILHCDLNYSNKTTLDDCIQLIDKAWETTPPLLFDFAISLYYILMCLLFTYLTAKLLSSLHNNFTHAPVNDNLRFQDLSPTTSTMVLKALHRDQDLKNLASADISDKPASPFLQTILKKYSNTEAGQLLIGGCNSSVRNVSLFKQWQDEASEFLKSSQGQERQIRQ